MEVVGQEILAMHYRIQDPRAGDFAARIVLEHLIVYMSTPSVQPGHDGSD